MNKYIKSKTKQNKTKLVRLLWNIKKKILPTDYLIAKGKMYIYNVEFRQAPLDQGIRLGIPNNGTS